MIEFLSPAVLSAVLRVSSSPIFSMHLAMASMRTLRDVPGCAVESSAVDHAVGTQEGARRV
ncbi:hypothetical protein PQR05_20010 [Paraburkholderia sediminicola]|uniref:hypothetical protein n=1 Tax=Paraburkholderia sediminicola TaxID=458836 RepID=UPI0038BCB087